MPLTKLDLYDPESVTVKSLFYIYSMESFIYRVMNSAARDYNQAKVDTMGPFACALSRALQWAQRQRRLKVQNPTGTKPKFQDAIVEDGDEDIEMLYTGTKFWDFSEIEEYKQLIGQKINLRGFSSFSDNEEVAKEFCLK